MSIVANVPKRAVRRKPQASNVAVPDFSMPPASPSPAFAFGRLSAFSTPVKGRDVRAELDKIFWGIECVFRDPDPKLIAMLEDLFRSLAMKAPSGTYRQWLQLFWSLAFMLERRVEQAATAKASVGK